MSNNSTIHSGLEVKDYSISQDNFTLVESEIEGALKSSPELNPEQLAKYYDNPVYQPHSDTKSLFDRIYNIFRAINISSKISKIRKYKSSGSILDIGCGVGSLLSEIGKKGWTIMGVEPSDRAREIATKSCNTEISSDISLKSIPSNNFDIVTMFHVLEHVQSAPESVKELKRVVKDDGTIFIAVPNYKSFDAQYYKDRWAALDVPRHRYHFSKESIKNLFEAEGMRVVKHYPMLMDSFYVSLLSEQYRRGGKTILGPIMATSAGLVSNVKALFTGEYSSIIYVIKKA